MAFTAVELLEMVLHLWKCLFTVPNAGANGSQTMKKTKIIVVTMLVGFALHRPALCQSNATDASLAESNLLYGAMVSNVIKMSTAGETSTNAAASIVAETNSPATNTGSNEPASGAITSNPASTSASPASTTGSNQPVSFTTSNASASGAMTSNPASTSASPTATAGSNQPVSFTSSNQTATSSATSNVAVVTSGSNATAAAMGSNQPISFTSSNQTATSSATSNVTAGSNYITAGSSNTMASDNGSNATTEAGATNSQASAEASAPAAAAELPISFQDTPITAAIEALARLAGINYLLDPKIGYGQPDANGQIKPEPTLSIRWENVTAQQALLALLDNYGLQLAGNPKTGIFKITTKDPSAPPELITRVIQLKYASTSNMMDSVVSTLTDKRSKVVADPRTSQLVVVATENEQSDVDTLISQLDTPTRQVLIETKLVELSSNPSTQKGVDWSGTLQAQNVSFGNGVLNQPSLSSSTTTLPGTPVTVTIPAFGGHPASTTTTTPSSSTATTLISEPQNSLSAGGLNLNTASGLTPGIGFLSADGVKAVLSFLNQSAEAQVVSTPRVVTLDNETATISVTRAFPIINITAGTANTAGGSSLSYSNLGTILIVTPRISANDFIWLKVTPTVSSFFGKDTETVNGAVTTADIFDLRTIDTQVLIPNAHTLVMGGLVQDNPNAQYTKVPILGDIPILGLAFRSENKSLSKDNLLIFITPTIVRSIDFKPSNEDFLNSEPRFMKDPMKMHTWLDSAQPRGDWSNPLPPNKIGSTQNSDEGNTTATP